MGTIKQGILGGFSGSVAGVVGSSWKGIAVIKSKPLSVANPRTAAQTAQRSKFSGVVALASLMLAGLVKPLWDRFSSQASGYNDFVKRNIDAFDSAGDLDPTELVISTGKMAGTAITSIADYGTTPQIDINWVDDSGAGLKLATDAAYVAVVDSNAIPLAASAQGAVRSDATQEITLNRQPVLGETLTIYLAFRRADGTVVSDSTYAQVVPM